MARFTIKNLTELDDNAGENAPGIEARFARKPLDSQHLGVTHIRYQPGTRSPMSHSHREQEEVYVVVSGSGKIRLDDETSRAWDAVRMAPETVRALEAGPERGDRDRLGPA